MRRFTFDRDFYMPKADTLRQIDSAGTDAAVYFYESGAVLYAIGFHGKAAKPDWHHRFRSEAERQAHADRFIAGRKSRAVMMADIKARRSAPHTLAPGAILVSSWGYDQTNVDWYEVTRIVGAHTVEIRPIRAMAIDTGYMQARETPAVGQYCGEPMLRRASADGSVKIGHHSASLWDGRPHHSSSYA